MVATNDVGDVVAIIGGSVWRYLNGGGWAFMQNAVACSQAGIDVLGRVTGEFPGYHLWRATTPGSWTQLNPGGADASWISVNDSGNLVAIFGGAIWRLNNLGWAFMQNAVNCSQADMDDSGAVTGEFPGYKLWRATSPGAWTALNPNGADASWIAVNAAGDVAALFGGAVWQYSAGNGWAFVHNAVNASRVAVDDRGAVLGEFPNFGVWLNQDGTNWLQQKFDGQVLDAVWIGGRE